eukprot:7319931-Pyramimonas_sp.AAC.1
MGAFRLANGDYRRSNIQASGNNLPTELFMSFDKNPSQIKLEIATKTARKTLLELYPSMRFFVDGHAGVVSSQWKPL